MIGYRGFIFHSGESYGIVKRCHITRFIDNKTNAILHGEVETILKTLECDQVIQQNDHVLFCNQIPDATWEEIT